MRRPATLAKRLASCAAPHCSFTALQPVATGLKLAYDSPATGVYIGAYRGSCEQPFTGDVDEIHIDNGARSGSQVAADAVRDAGRASPPQTSPVSGMPAVASSRRCFAITASPKRLVARRRTKLAVTVRRAGKALVGRRVSVRGLGVKRTVRTGRGGLVRFSVRVSRRGKLKLRASGQPTRCTRIVIVKKRR